jgi:predicted membrane channel-forming protein YqfA (hemolysin III family)
MPFTLTKKAVNERHLFNWQKQQHKLPTKLTNHKAIAILIGMGYIIFMRVELGTTTLKLSRYFVISRGIVLISKTREPTKLCCYI